MQVPAALSVDLEFFQHAPAYRMAAGTAEEPAIGREGAEFLIDAFDRADATGTFFTVSDIAAEHADLLDRVASSHELGSHTHTHRHLSELRTDGCREGLAGSRDAPRSGHGRGRPGLSRTLLRPRRGPLPDAGRDRLRVLR